MWSVNIRKAKNAIIDFPLDEKIDNKPNNTIVTCEVLNDDIQCGNNAINPRITSWRFYA